MENKRLLRAILEIDPIVSMQSLMLLLNKLVVAL